MEFVVVVVAVVAFVAMSSFGETATWKCDRELLESGIYPSLLNWIELDVFRII